MTGTASIFGSGQPQFISQITQKRRLSIYPGDDRLSIQQECVWNQAAHIAPIYNSNPVPTRNERSMGDSRGFGFACRNVSLEIAWNQHQHSRTSLGKPVSSAAGKCGINLQPEIFNLK